MNDAPDILALHAGAKGDAIAVVVDDSGGARPSTTTFARVERDGEPSFATVCSRAASNAGSASCGAGPTRSRCSSRSTRRGSSVSWPYRSRTASVPKRWRTSSTTPTPRSSSPTPSSRPPSTRCAAALPKVRQFVCFGGDTPEGWDDWDRDVLAGRSDAEPPPVDASEAGAAMIYTSGTTGKPKGALRTSTDRTLVFALLDELRPAARELRAPHDRPAVPLRSARVRLARTHARCADRRAAQVRRHRLDPAREASTG